MLKPIRSTDQDAAGLNPDPDSQAGSGREVLIYDGQCKFCQGSVKYLRALDWTGRLAYISLHDSRVNERWPQLTYDQLMEQIWLVAKNGDTHGGADAIRYLSLRMPALWCLAPFLNLPFTMPIWRWFYRYVARNRYRIAGRDCDGGTCSIHARK